MSKAIVKMKLQETSGGYRRAFPTTHEEPYERAFDDRYELCSGISYLVTGDEAARRWLKTQWQHGFIEVAEGFFLPLDDLRSIVVRAA